MPLLLPKTNPITQKNKRFIYPATPTLIKKYCNERIYNHWVEMRSKINTLLNIDYDENLRDYQKEGVSKILKLKRCAIFDQQRLGKTPMTLSALKILNPEKTIIVAPKSTLLNWLDECKKWFTDDVVVLKGTPKKRKKLLSENHKVYIMNYTILSIDEDDIDTPNCMVIDEAHRMRNYKGQLSKRSPITIKAIIKKSYKVPIKLALTGTPAPNKPENIYPILHFLYPEIFTSYYNFINYYFDTEEVYVSQNKTIDEVIGFKENKERDLQEFLDYISLQRKRKDYIKWIPKVDKKYINTTLDKTEQKWYNKIVRTYECEELDINCENELTQMIALRKLTTMSKGKLEYIQDYIQDYPDESIIIVSEFSSYLSQLYDLIDIPKEQKRLIIGSCSEIYRKNAQDDFNNKNYKILLANIECIKEGIKLEQASTMIVIDPSLTYTDNEQLEDRLLPTTQEKALEKDKQQIIYLVTKDSIDEYIREQLNYKKEQVDIINNFKKYINTTKIM